MAWVIGVDVGGTFTDAVCSDGVSTWRAKLPTNFAFRLAISVQCSTFGSIVSKN